VSISLYTSDPSTSMPSVPQTNLLAPAPTLSPSPAYYTFSFPVTWTLDATVTRFYSISVSSDTAVNWNFPVDTPADHLPVSGVAIGNGSFASTDGGSTWATISYSGLLLRGSKAACSPSSTQTGTMSMTQTPSRSGTPTLTTTRTETPSTSTTRTVTSSATASWTSSGTIF